MKIQKIVKKKITYLSDVFPLVNLSNVSGNLYDEIKYLINLCKLMKIDTSAQNNNKIMEELLVEPFVDIKRIIRNV